MRTIAVDASCRNPLLHVPYLEEYVPLRALLNGTPDSMLALRLSVSGVPAVHVWRVRGAPYPFAFARSSSSTVQQQQQYRAPKS